MGIKTVAAFVIGILPGGLNSIVPTIVEYCDANGRAVNWYPTN